MYVPKFLLAVALLLIGVFGYTTYREIDVLRTRVENTRNMADAAVLNLDLEQCRMNAEFKQLNDVMWKHHAETVRIADDLLDVRSRSTLIHKRDEASEAAESITSSLVRFTADRVSRSKYNPMIADQAERMAAYLEALDARPVSALHPAN